MKATAIAHPIQGLIKYHGLRHKELVLPFHDSISVCTTPTETKTTIEFSNEYFRDEITLNGKRLADRELERVVTVVDAVRKIANSNLRFKAVSDNNFKSNIGLGASASGFAALAVAACEALDQKMSLEQISAIARRGAGSASRAVTGAFSHWHMGADDSSSYSTMIADDNFQMGIVVALIPALKLTEEFHQKVLGSPFFHSRLSYIHQALADMEQAIKNRDIETIGLLAERDTLSLHSLTMTGHDETILWKPDTLKVMAEVRAMREEGIPAYFSIDTGATVYINTFPEEAARVEKRIKKLGVGTMICGVGGPARVVGDHLF
jgi:phosphomevalonate decarboxylase